MNICVLLLLLLSTSSTVYVAATATPRISATSSLTFQSQSTVVTIQPTTHVATSSATLQPTPTVTSSTQQSVTVTSSSLLLETMSSSVLATTTLLTPVAPSSPDTQPSATSQVYSSLLSSATLYSIPTPTTFLSTTPVATSTPVVSPIPTQITITTITFLSSTPVVTSTFAVSPTPAVTPISTQITATTTAFLSPTPVATSTFAVSPTPAVTPISTQITATTTAFLSPTPVATSTPTQITATTTTNLPPTSPQTDPIQVLKRNLGLFITVGVVFLVCLILALICCFMCGCCICCYRMTRPKNSGYRRTEVFGEYPEEFNVNTTRFTYQRIQLAQPGKENVELAMLGAVLEEHRKKILPEHFKKHLDSLWAVELAELRDEFDMLEVSKIRQNSIVANLHTEIHKNKDFKFVPYDSNRVKLKNVASVRTSDYVNASYIRTPTIDQLFIVAQAPMEGTVNQFWQFVIEQNISNIVMLVPTGLDLQTNILPSQAHPVKLYDQLELSFEEEEKEIWATYRRFRIKNELGNIKHVMHGQFKEWIPKLGVPKFQHSFIKFIQTFKQRMISDNSPVLVYSLTGCGQTGLFIATYNLMQVINMSMPVSVFDTVLCMLEQRVCLVQSLEEYKFLHLAVLEMICDSTELLAREFPDAYTSYIDSLKDSYRSIFHRQFSELDYQVEKTHKRSQDEALNPVNRTKNSTLTVLPYDDTRVSLFSEFWEAGDYINASYIDGYKEPQYYIATSHPIRETILEFLQMVYQSSAPLVLLLATEDEFALLQTGLDGSVCYWSEDKQGFGMYSVENLGSTNSVGLVRNKIKITNHSENSSHTFIQYICTNFLDNNKPTNSQAVIHLTDLITKFKQEYTASPVVVHCWDGIGKTGVLVACSIATQQLASEDRVDMFHIVKGMRRGREKMVSPVDLYIVCFDIIKDLIVKSGQNTQDSQAS